MAFVRMDYTFKKKDAPSCLVTNKTWEEIINTPSFFPTFVSILSQMVSAAEREGVLTKSMLLSKVKEIVSSVLITPLINTLPEHNPSSPQPRDTIIVDALWDEIIPTDAQWKDLYSALEKAYDMFLQIRKASPLEGKDTLQVVKDEINACILKPLNGIKEDE
jgi:hypothetical protein